MKRDIDINEISDGNLYGLNDMVKCDCNDCQGCSSCCRGMGESIVLDPLDIYRLTTNLQISFEQLLYDKIELNVQEGVILPNLKMADATDACAFLDENGRCSIHEHRPGICRIFPLGRLYEDRSFQYFLQVNECKKENRTKTKVKKWIATSDLKKNEQFIIDWHYFIDDIQEKFQTIDDEERIKKIDLFLLQQFFIEPYSLEVDFYEQFAVRFQKAKAVVASLLA